MKTLAASPACGLAGASAIVITELGAVDVFRLCHDTGCQ